MQNPATLRFSLGIAVLTLWAWSAQAAEIVFDRADASGNRDIFVVGPSGANEQRLTTDTAADHSPALSPNGELIAFISNRDGADAVHLLERQSGVIRRLTHGFGPESDPSWSPDGQRIAFARKENGDARIHLTDPTGSSDFTVSTLWGDHSQPEFFPYDSSILVYVRSYSVWGLLVPEPILLDVATGTEQSLGVLGDQVSWSPDGWRLAVLKPFSTDEIQVVWLSDGRVETVSTGVSIARRPEWSPSTDLTWHELAFVTLAGTEWKLRRTLSTGGSALITGGGSVLHGTEPRSLDWQ